TAAALTRIGIRNGKRPLRRTDDLKVSFNIQPPSMSTSNVFPPKTPTRRLESQLLSSRPSRPLSENHSTHSVESSPFLIPTNTPSRPASFRRSSRPASSNTLDHPNPDQHPNLIQRHTLTGSPVEPISQVNDMARTNKRPRQSYTRTASAPDLLKTIDGLPGSLGLPHSPRQKVAAFENRQVLQQPIALTCSQPCSPASSTFPLPSQAISLLSQSPIRTQTPQTPQTPQFSPSVSLTRRTPIPSTIIPPVVSPLAAYSHGPVPVTSSNPTWEEMYSTLPLGTVPEPDKCSNAPFQQKHLAYVPLRKSTQQRSIHGHFFMRCADDEKLVECQALVKRTKTNHEVEETGTGIATRFEATEICGQRFSYNGGTQRRITHIEKYHRDIYDALLDFRKHQEIMKSEKLAKQWEEKLHNPSPSAQYNAIREDVL
ncbi:hypothetical protein FBU30_001818, partial [Linnemannia zychae]